MLSLEQLSERECYKKKKVKSRWGKFRFSFNSPSPSPLPALGPCTPLIFVCCNFECSFPLCLAFNLTFYFSFLTGEKKYIFFLKRSSCCCYPSSQTLFLLLFLSTFLLSLLDNFGFRFWQVYLHANITIDLPSDFYQTEACIYSVTFI
jgi:hypothetical protein